MHGKVETHESREEHTYLMQAPPITVHASPSGIIVSSASADGSPAPTPTTTTAPVQYRVEERRRTVYVTSDVPPTQWDTKVVKDIFKLANIQETDGAAPTHPVPRRTKSLTEREILIFQDSSNQRGAQASSPTSSRSKRQSFRASRLAERSTMTPQTPPNSSSPATNLHAFPKTPTPVMTPKILPKAPTPPPSARILFYHRHDPHYGFTNFSAHPVVYQGKRYPTSEHLFQSFKFHEHRPGLAEHIRTCSDRPSVAFSEARRFQPEARPDWMQVNIQKMDETLALKFTQDLDLQEELLATGNAELVEDSDKDAFWGVGPDGRGRNELGKALERLRDSLRDA